MWTLIDTMQARGLAKSDRDVSRRWLGRGPNYLSDRKGQMTLGTLLFLYIRLIDAGHADLAQEVWREITAGLPLKTSGDIGPPSGIATANADRANG